MPAVFGVLVWLWLSYNWELQQKNIATTRTSDKSENAITKQKNSWLNFNRMHATFSSNWSTSKMFKQASLKPVEPFTIINNQWKSSQLSTGDHPCPRGPVGSTAVLSLRWDNKKIRKQVAFWTATNFLGDKAMKYPLQGEMWKYMIIAKTLVSLKHIARDENVLTKFSSGHRIATASEKGTVIRWRIFVLCSSCTDH